LAIGARTTELEEVIDMIKTFISTKFEGGRHQRRVNKLGGGMYKTLANLVESDPEITSAVEAEFDRQQTTIELIASENIVSKAILEAQGSVLTNKYAEGYIAKRYYGGCEFVDVVEELAIERLKKLYGVKFANVQPHSGSQANQAVFLATLQPGDTFLGMSLDSGGTQT